MTCFVYVGAYAQGRAAGIHVFRFDATTGALSPVSAVTGIVNPSFLALDPSSRFLYAVNEIDDQRGGAVSAYAVDRQTGLLTPLNRQLTHGAGPCYVSLDRSGRCVLVANYASGQVTVLPVRPDGSLLPASTVIQHRGSSVNPQRQAGPHAHSILMAPANDIALAADLGLDRLMLYRLDATNGALTPHDPPWASCRPGAGPRHLAFHPGGRTLVVSNELDSTVTVFAYEASRGTVRELQTLSTLPPDFAGENYPAHIAMAASGRHFYVSNRGHDSLAVFAMDPPTGQLTAAGHQSTLGHWPRHFALDPTGRWLIAANQRGGTLVTFRVDPATGRLESTGFVTAVPSPACVQMIELPQANR
jgi:6-phosphogluconolactonase